MNYPNLIWLKKKLKIKVIGLQMCSYQILHKVNLETPIVPKRGLLRVFNFQQASGIPKK